jgi:hypothetical protein
MGLTDDEPHPTLLEHSINNAQMVIEETALDVAAF